ncbi:hypothetical protein [uncultured Flavobacterium sp.]|uniref:hypothetical protein n=1 Tax=uncultured Flavobacterium sp. TaxID=165435 RepID=UPI0025920F7C|nr:hypothetical protein [uncultured Flavobacterium sp.]
MGTLIANISLLNRRVVLKHTRLLALVAELEAKQLGLAEVTNVITLITGLNKDLGFKSNPLHNPLPYYVPPTQEDTP